MGVVASGRRRRMVVPVAVAVLALAGVGAGLWAGRARLWPEPAAEARAAYERGEYEAAADLARRRLHDAPADRDALRVLARASGRLGRADAAQAMFNRLGVDTLAVEDLVVLAGGLLGQGKRSEAQLVLGLARAKDGDHPEALDLMAGVLADNGHPDAAVELARRLAGRPGWEARGALRLGRLLDRQDDPAGAADALARALRLDPDLAGADDVRKMLARDLLRVGKPAEAAVALRPIGADPDASWLLSRARIQQGDMAGATAALRAAGDRSRPEPHAPEPAPFVGSARCAGCHREEHRAEQSSRHARSFWVGDDLARMPLPDGPVADPGRADVVHSAERTADGPRWRTEVDGAVQTALIEYAFGSDDRGLTPVGRDERGQYREIRLSHYGNIDLWDVTSGHPPAPGAAAEYLGQPLSADDVRLCLGCHTTEPIAARDRTPPTAADRGIGCERCHGPGGNHVKAVNTPFPEPAIGRPRLATGAQVTALCAGCHSPPPGREVPPDLPMAVRFQGTTLPWSRCFKASDGRLGCTTCHDPHHDATEDASFYVAKCLGCHSTEGPAGRVAGTRPAALAADAPRVACPVNPAGDCLGCHMPQTSTAVPHTTFTDHHIRVHRETAAE